MIRAFIFDLDGTLVDTEALKAQAYARVSQDLLGLSAPDERAIATYRRLVGNTDETVARAMVSDLDLAVPLGQERDDPRRELWEVLHERRVDTYRREVATDAGLRGAEFRHNTGVLKAAKADGALTAVATSSYRTEASRVLGALGLTGHLDVVVCRDDVTVPKPDPEIYLTTMNALGVRPGETLIVEDSPVGLQAAVASGAMWVCVANQFSAPHLRATAGIDLRWVVFDPDTVAEVVAARRGQMSAR